MTQEQAHPVLFTGNGWEYFKIYFVNIMLSILTLGIYSAWAKVRNKRYFYGHTSLAGSSFDYHARPMQILKGRAIVVTIIILYELSVTFVPFITPVFTLLFFFGIPFLIARATKFNMQYSSYRQIRFNFIGEYLYVFFHFIVLPITSLFTLGLAYPYAIYKQRQYIANNTKYGNALFFFKGKSGEFFLTYFVAFFSLVGLYMLILASFNLIDAGTWEAFQKGFTEGIKKSLENNSTTLYADEKTPTKQVYMILAGVYGFLIFNFLLFSAYVNARLTNYLFNNLDLSNISFSSNISF